MYLSMTIKRKENRLMTLYFGDKNRYSLNQLIEYLPSIYGANATANIHFEPKESINTYWMVCAPARSRDLLYIENAVSKVRLSPIHLQLIQRGTNTHDMYMHFDDQSFYKLFVDSDSVQSPVRGGRGAEEQQGERNYLWVEYLKFNKTENKYEFSKFGKLNEEDKANFFDSFKILPIDIYKQHSLLFISNAFVALRGFDFYQAVSY